MSPNVPLSLKFLIAQKKQKCNKPTDVTDRMLGTLVSRPMSIFVAVNEKEGPVLLDYVTLN